MAPYQGTLLSIRRMVARMGRLEGDGVNGAGDSDMIDEWINLGYQQVVQDTQALEQTGTASLTDAVASYDLPSQVAQINEITVTYQDGTTSAPMQRVPLDTILQYRRTTLATNEQLWRAVYAMVGMNQLEIWPTPGPGQSLTFRYVYLPDELTADGDIPLVVEPFGSKLLTYAALIEGARFLKDPLIPDYEPAYQAWLARHQIFLNRRNGASTVAFRSGNSYNSGDAWLGSLARDVG